MKRLDLIFECIDKIINDEVPELAYLIQVRQYARELREMKPVGEVRTVVWGGMAWSVGFVAHTKLELKTKLYALGDEK